MKARGGRGQGQWQEAAELVARYVPGRIHLDELLEGHSLPELRWLVMEVFRQWLVIDGILKGRMARRPRPIAQSILRLALAECLNREEGVYPKIVHHAVEAGRRAGLSKAELGFVNGVLRAILRSGELQEETLWKSHPRWLVDRWIRQFGKEPTGQLLSWNQAVPVLTIHAGERPEYGEPTSHEGFFTIQKGRFADALEDLEAGRAYMQDPFTRIPVDLLGVRPGDCVMDLCAAPGGKSRLLAGLMKETGRLLLVDRPGKRLERLKSNMALLAGPRIDIVGSDLRSLDTAPMPAGIVSGTVDAILIDVPCSNTGVIQKRPDVKIRLKEDTFARMAELQFELIRHAAPWLRPGGRLVYSTCSLEPEENAEVIQRFLRANPAFRQEACVVSYPWRCGHDGGGAFLLTKSAPV